MKIFPAIDILGGKVVRLRRGDYNDVKTYETDCAQTATAFRVQGASCLHAVDLDGARIGKAVNAGAVERIISAADLFVEIGGGIRTEEQIQSYIEAGAGRVILGTVAVRDFGFTSAMVEKYGDKIAVGVDAADGNVAVAGWREVTDIRSVEFCERLAKSGVKSVIYTDISRDGMLGGTNMQIYSRLMQIDGLNITASGGISSIEEITALKDMGVHAAILGKALYENRLSLKAALAAAEDL